MKETKKLMGIIIMLILMTIFIACGQPKLKGKVTIDGEPMLGNTLRLNTSSLSGEGYFSYQWMRNGNVIDDETYVDYKLENIDKNAVITVTVSRSDRKGSVTSSPVTAYGYAIGDTGPGGGIIFYRNTDGFIMTDTGEKAYYLEAAAINQGQLKWASPLFIPREYGGLGNWVDIMGTYKDINNSSIGSGRKNTALILAIDANAPAALACKNYNGGGKTDWFLPSIDELDKLDLYESKNNSGISTGWFWSSTTQQYEDSPESQAAQAWSIYFDSLTGDGHTRIKNNNNNVRAVRAF